MLLPTTCPICRRPGQAPCATCAKELRRAPSFAVPPQVDVAHALLAYEGAGRELVARLKYRNARSSLAWLAAHQAEQVLKAATLVDAVTWVPTSPERRRDRGFDQAQLLARAVARNLHRPCRALLERRPGPAQTGRSAAQRRAGPPLRLARHAVVPAHVLVVDDVITTGATVSAAARVLRRAGADFVAVSAVARTPRKGLS
ncbi:MAG: ComF family protein [Acidimicrobiales bacterium]